MVSKDFYDREEDITGKFNMKIECNPEDVKDIIKALKEIYYVTLPKTGIQSKPYSFRKFFYVNCKIKENIKDLNPTVKGSTNRIDVELTCYDETYQNVRNTLSKIFYLKRDINRKSYKGIIYLTLKFIKTY